jgi:16S rRNA (cytidine1402-2'-O)-methyltransferase
METSGTIYMIPTPVYEGNYSTLAQEVFHYTGLIKHFYVENLRTARRVLRGMHPQLDLNAIQFVEISKHDTIDFRPLQQWIHEGLSVGIMSEAGCPGIADPGAEIVAYAHRNNIKVIPLSGPSSIILALMGSGLNGQNFAFRGYLPLKEPKRSQSIRQLEHYSREHQQTQIFIETPYRNSSLFQDLIKNCHPSTRLCIAQNISAPDASIQTYSVEIWKKKSVEFAKVPVVFLILA